MIATILMVAITVVLAAVLYVMVTSIIIVDDHRKPLMTLRPLECAQGSCDADVTSAQPATDVSQFRVTVFADGQRVLGPTTLVAGQDIAGGGVTLRFTDIGSEGKVTAGDWFRLSGASPGVTYELDILWQDGSIIGSVDLAA